MWIQNIIVYLVVAAAAWYVGRMLWSAASGGKSGCNSCGTSCSSHEKSTPTPRTPEPLLQIDMHNLNGKH